jgi:hypothetical protein
MKNNIKDLPKIMGYGDNNKDIYEKLFKALNNLDLITDFIYNP